jgi:hypothetical protein
LRIKEFMQTESNQKAWLAYFAVASAIGVWLLWDAVGFRLVTYSLWADYWEHSAALTEWMRNLAAPGNPHLAGGDSSSRYIPSFLLFAAAGQAFGLNAVELMSINAVVNYLLVAVGIYLFSRAYFRDPWAPLILYVVLFAAWGVPWIWSNLYHLRSFFMVASYPSTFVFGLCLIAFWYSLRFLRCKTSLLGALGILLVLSALMFVSHALTGVFGIAGCCLLACTERDAPLSMRGLLLLAMPVGALLAEFWPYFSVWDVVLNKSDAIDDRTWQSFQGLGAMLARARSGEWWHILYDPQQLLVGLGVALVGVPISLWLAIKRQHSFIWLGALGMAVPYFGNIFYQIALAHRFLFYVVFFLHLAIVWAILELKATWQESRQQSRAAPLVTTSWYGAIVTLVILGVANIWLLAADFQGRHLNQNLEWVNKRQYLPAGATVVDVFTELTAGLPENAVVIGNAKLTWPLPTFRGKAVSLPENHENSLVPDEAERIVAEKLFMDALTTDADRSRIIQEFGVSHVLVNSTNTPPELLRWLERNANPLAIVERYEIYTLNGAGKEG